MVATRAMAAKKAPSTADDKENDHQLALRKKPIRRATAKAAATSTASTTTAKPTRRAAAAVIESPAPHALPLSPKKVTQVARTRTAHVQPELDKAASAPPTRKAAPKRHTRAAVSRAATVTTPPKKVPVTRRKAALPEAAKPRTARPKASDPEPQPEPHAESQVEAEIEAEEEQHPTPNIRVTRSHQARDPAKDELEAANDQEQAEADDKGNDSSDDEICGPKTPMRRTATAATSQTASRHAAPSTTTRKLQTPARRFLVHRANHATPQTQRLPQKPASISSSPRPMTVARGTEKPMVFRPLKQQTRHQSPLPALDSRQSDADAQENGQNESKVDESSADELDNVHDGDITVIPTPARSVRFEGTLSDSDDELARSNQPSDQDEETEEDTIEEEDNTKEPDYVFVQEDDHDYVSDDSASVIEGSDIDDSILAEPQFSADFTTSVPSSPATVDAEPPQTALDDSELLSSPVPSTPGSVVQRDLEDDSSPTQEIASTPNFSLEDRELLSLIEQDDEKTPNAKFRVSFSTATAKMLQTPRMQFALGGVDPVNVDKSPSVTTEKHDETLDDQTLTINPSLLEVDEFGVKLATNLENAALIPTPYLATPTARQRISMGVPKERMSLLQDDVFNLVDFDHDSPAKASDGNATLADKNICEPTKMSTPGDNTRRQSYHVRDVSTPHNMTTNERQTSTVMPDSASYTRSTFAFDSRRKSLPAASFHTPVNSDSRPRTAETTIKPSTSDSFAKLWVGGQRRPSVRRSFHVATDAAEAETSLPTSQANASKRISTPYQRSVCTTQTNPVSPYVPFSGARPRRHTPSSSYKAKTNVRSPLKGCTKVFSGSRSPLKLRDASRSPIKRLREAPRTPMKTPLKGPCLATPGYPMTPHPLQPLKSVTALVEVFTLDGSSASGPFTALLQGLGARTTKTWSDRVTHVIFKDGSPTTLQKVRLNNKDPDGKKIFCVNSRWVTDCERNGTRMDEQADIYTVDVDEVPRGGCRRRKSMEPAALRNVDGNVVHSNNSSANSSASRKSISSRQSLVGGRQSIGLCRANKSLARVSLASSFWGSPVKKTPGRNKDNVSWDDDEEMADAFFDEPTAKFEIPL